MLLDLEALFSQRVKAFDLEQKESFAEAAIFRSVLHTGLLPQVSIGEPDLSGLGTVEGEFAPVEVPQWEHSYTDLMQYSRKPMPMRGSTNRPTLAGDAIDLADYSECIVVGFHDMYRLLVTNRDELNSANGPLSSFAQDEVRVILRMTRTYARLLEEGFHPDVLRDAADRDRLFDQLWVPYEYLSFLSKVTSA
jgi:lantibiotic modifying enzyme